MNQLCEQHKGASATTEDGHFTVKLAGFEKAVNSPKFIVTDKREPKHQKYELVQGLERTWGLTNLATREWNPVSVDKDCYFPDLDHFFKTTKTQPIYRAGKELCGKILHQPRDLPPRPPPMTLMNRVSKMIKGEEFSDDELSYWKEWFRYGLEAIPPEKVDRSRHIWLYNFAYDEM